jgi:DNA repair protein RadA/Sms
MLIENFSFMSKSQTIFICSNCHYQSLKWQGKCSNCGEWNTFEEKLQVAKSRPQNLVGVSPVNLADLAFEPKVRFPVGISEFDEVIGNGIVPGSLILLGGDPGIGKSTLALQIAVNLSKSVLYVSGEESANQIKMRGERISKNHNFPVLAETDLTSVIATIETVAPKLVIIDSIQTMYSETASGVAGGVSQVTFAVQTLMRLAKALHIAIILIGHVTKEGNLAGPKTLEHMVDTVLYLEGERFANLRILRCVKNRFGTTNEVGVFEMSGSGLMEVKNPSELFLGEDSIKASGNVITSVMEGSRALLIEIQSLTSVSNFGYPKRTTTGYDSNRLQLITAILSKRANLNLANQDIFVNVVGGIKIDEPAGDLAVALSIVSSVKDIVIADTVVVGELGLSGEVRFVSNLEKRIKEAEKLGFKKIICPKSKIALKSNKLEIFQVRKLNEAIACV